MVDFERHYNDQEEARQTHIREYHKRRLLLEKEIVRDQVKTVFERIQQEPPLKYCTWVNFEGRRQVSWSLLSGEDCTALIVILPDGRLAWEEHHYDGSSKFLEVLDLDSFITGYELPEEGITGYHYHNLREMCEYIIKYGENFFDIPKDKISEWQEMARYAIKSK
jgi:hypothetical protein